MAIKQVAYAGLFLIKRVLEWFKPYFTNCLLLLAILILPYVFDSPKVVTVAASTWAASTAFSGILLLSLFHFYCNFGSECVTR